MNKQEFLHELEKSLRGKVDDGELNRQIEYYSSYIRNEIHAGRTEEEVLEELGDPRLIARTIVQTYNMKDDPVRNEYKDTGSFDDESQGNENRNTLKSKISMYLVIAAIVIIIFAVFSLVFSVLRIIFPVIAMVILIMLIIRMVR